MSLRRSQTDERICASATLSRKTSLPSNARPPSCSPERHVAVPPAPEHAPNIGANDLAGSTLSLESFPPPPPPLQLGDVLSWPSTSNPICSVARSEERPSLQHVVVRQKPPPPKRSESTRLSSSAWRSSPAGPVTCSKPPDVFLRDLQRVMEKKWKVAQQLSSEPTATPHEILGFRDPCCLPPPGTECAAMLTRKVC
ncbi:hypothetical protein MRX96_005764 [Rhipicephalus microplus]